MATMTTTTAPTSTAAGPSARRAPSRRAWTSTRPTRRSSSWPTCPAWRAGGLDVVAERRRAHHPRTRRASGQPARLPGVRAGRLPPGVSSPRTSTPTGINATLRDGVLRVEIPKSPGVQPKKIPVRDRVSQESTAMGIMDKVGALLPWRGERRESAAHARRGRWRSATTSTAGCSDCRRARDSPRSPRSAWMPSVDVRETDDELVVTVEVPGLDRDDLDLVITPDGLTIRGEKREEKEDTRTDYRLVRVALRELRPDRAAAAGARPRPGGGPRQGRRADRQVPEGGRAPRHAPHPDQDMMRRRD